MKKVKSKRRSDGCEHWFAQLLFQPHNSENNFEYVRILNKTKKKRRAAKVQSVRKQKRISIELSKFYLFYFDTSINRNGMSSDTAKNVSWLSLLFFGFWLHARQVNPRKPEAIQVHFSLVFLCILFHSNFVKKQQLSDFKSAFKWWIIRIRMKGFTMFRFADNRTNRVRWFMH